MRIPRTVPAVQPTATTGRKEETKKKREELSLGERPALVERFGEVLGRGLGVIVTKALRAVPEWNEPLRDSKGRPVQQIPGAKRIGDHDLRKRHEEFVGPKINTLAEKLPPGVVHDLFEGLGRGATEAPGLTYRLEAKLEDMFK